MAKKKTNPEGISVPPQAARRRAAPKTNTAKNAGNGRTEPTQAEIAEAAYFKHLNRSGAQGDEFRDWIEAERELKERHSR